MSLHRLAAFLLPLPDLSPRGRPSGRSNDSIRQRRSTQGTFIVPEPPFFTIFKQARHVPHSLLKQPIHCPHRNRREYPFPEEGRDMGIFLVCPCPSTIFCTSMCVNYRSQLVWLLSAVEPMALRQKNRLNFFVDLTLPVKSSNETTNPMCWLNTFIIEPNPSFSCLFVLPLAPQKNPVQGKRFFRTPDV